MALLIADQILSATNKYRLPPTIAPIKVPKVVVPQNMIDRVRVMVDGRVAGETATITNIGQMAIEQYAAIYPQVIARAVVRRVVKKGVIYGAKQPSAPIETRLWTSGSMPSAWPGKPPKRPIRGAGDYCPKRFRCCAWNCLREFTNSACNPWARSFPALRSRARRDHKRPQHLRAGELSRHAVGGQDSAGAAAVGRHARAGPQLEPPPFRRYRATTRHYLTVARFATGRSAYHCTRLDFAVKAGTVLVGHVMNFVC